MKADGTSGIAQAARPIRVVHIVPSMFGKRFGGHSRYVCALLSGWHDPDVTLDLWGTTVKPLNMNSGSLDYQLPEGENLWSTAGEFGRLDLLREAARLLATLALRGREVDIAHFHGLWWGELLSPVVLRRLGKKAVHTTSLFGCDNPGRVRERWGSLGLNLYRRFDGVVALSPALAEDCGNHGISRVLCLPNFLLVPELEAGRNESLRAAMRSRHRIPPEDAALLFIGAAIQRKGIDVLIESYIRIARNYPRTWLILVGPCDKTAVAGFDLSYVDEQRGRLQSAHLSDRVIWAGMITDRRELVGYYSAADIFVFPTRREGSPNVLVEAMAAGLPIAATKLPGCTDNVVVDGESGFLTPLDDAGALARSIERLISDPSLLARMSSSARGRSRLFGFESYCRKLKGFYLDVMRAKPK
jgi:glycosyltransferase involved in cell wall biosynthesis